MAMFMSINGERVGVDTGPERGATRCNYSITQRNVAFVFRDIFADKKNGANFRSHLHFGKFERTQLQNLKHCAPVWRHIQGCGGLAPRVLGFGTRWNLEVIFTDWTLYVGIWVLSSYRNFGWLDPTGALAPLAQRRTREWNLTQGLWQFLSPVPTHEMHWTGAISKRLDCTVANTACWSEYWLDAQHAWENDKHTKHFCMCI